MKSEFTENFLELLENINNLKHEIQHSNASVEIKNEIININKFLSNLNIITNNNEDYIFVKMLNIMDYFFYNYIIKLDKKTYDYKVVNSLYDIIRSFYFNL